MNCWHFLLFIVYLPMLASLVMQRLCCCWLPAVTGLSTATSIPVASAPAMTSMVLLAFMLLLILFLASLLLLASQLLQTSLLMFTSVMLLSLQLCCQYTCCFWLLIPRTCVAGLPAVAGIHSAAVSMQFSCAPCCYYMGNLLILASLLAA
jgi:hypothetical protein